MKLQYERITVNYNYWLSVVVVGSVYSEAFGDVNLPHMPNVGLSEDALASLLEISFPLSWNESGAVQVKKQQQQTNKQKRKQKTFCSRFHIAHRVLLFSDPSVAR